MLTGEPIFSVYHRDIAVLITTLLIISEKPYRCDTNMHIYQR